MEKIILRQKWLGFAAVILISLILAVYTSNSLNTAYEAAEPTVSQEIGYFLPVTIKNGEIVSPRNALIERSYGPAQNQYKVVLNTEIEDLNISDLSSGIYVTRNKFYSYDSNKGEVKIQSLAKVPDVELTTTKVKDFLSMFGEYLKPVTMFIIFVSLAIYIGLAVLAYSVIMHWLFKRLYNADFALTLRVNTLTYLALLCISTVLGMNVGIIVTLLVMLAGNYLANILLENK